MSPALAGRLAFLATLVLAACADTDRPVRPDPTTTFPPLTTTTAVIPLPTTTTVAPTTTSSSTTVAATTTVAVTVAALPPPPATTVARRAAPKPAPPPPAAKPKPAPSGGAVPVGVWDAIAQCESGGQWNHPPVHNRFGTFSGGLMIGHAYWAPNGGGQYASAPYLATKAQQIAVAQNIANAIGLDRGWQCWPIP